MLSMNILCSILFLFYLALPASYISLQIAQNLPVKVTEPQSGDVIQGLVLIYGTTNVAGFRKAEVSFGYQDDPTEAWFLIEQSTTPVQKDLIARWDTSMITDGEYQLRVKVELEDGQSVQTTVWNLRVRNYTLVETSTPDSSPSRVAVPTVTPLSDYVSQGITPVPLPTNPAQINPSDLQTSALRGAGYAIAALVILGLYWGIRAAARRS